MAFSEALQIARDRDVDFILLGGDLFHVNKPSTSVEHKCIKIIRQHMTSKADRQTTFKRISGQLSHVERLNHANFEDPNLNVQFPIFTIHGNHDDPTGPNARSVCEKLATCGLINYFGLVKPMEDKSIMVEPIVIQKGEIKIALYGIGFIPDQKLRQAFENHKIHFTQPSGDTFNILIVHQNRIKFDKNKYIPDSLFPKFFHLIIRGHEHNTQMPERIPDSEVNGLVYQPGSTVATSISVMEAGSKRVSVMSVGIKNPRGNMAERFQLDYELVTLKCCRPMIFKDISQKEIFKYIKARDSRKKLTPVEYRCIFRDFVIEYVEKLVKEFKASDAGSAEEMAEPQKSDPVSLYQKLHRFELPLMRVRLEYVNKAERFDESEVESVFYPNRVANRDIVLFKKQKLAKNDEGETENVTFANENLDEEDEVDDIEVINLSDERRDTIDTMIEGYFVDKCASERLAALSLQEYTNAVRAANEDGNVISKVLSKKRTEVLKLFEKAVGDEECALANFHDEDKVRDWILAAFKNETNVKRVGGDQYTIAMEAAIAMRDDSDIEWED